MTWKGVCLYRWLVLASGGETMKSVFSHPELRGLLVTPHLKDAMIPQVCKYDRNNIHHTTAELLSPKATISKLQHGWYVPKGHSGYVPGALG